MNNQLNQNLNICDHGFNYGYCPNLCIKFSSLKEKIAEDRRQFLEQFNQTPRPISQLRRRAKRMDLIAKQTFIYRLLQYRKLERQAKY